MLCVSGSKVANLIANLGLSQSAFATKAIVEPDTVSSIIKGGDEGTKRQLKTAKKIARKT